MYKLPDNTEIEIDSNLTNKVARDLYKNPSQIDENCTNSKSIVEIIIDEIEAFPCDVQRDFKKNLVFTGGCSLTKGMQTFLK